MLSFSNLRHDAPRRLLEQLTEIKCGVGPMGITLQEQVAKADKWTEQALSVYEGDADDYASLGRLVDAAEDVPAPRRALTACSRRHRFLQWVREARGALVACSVREPGDHDEVIRPGMLSVSSSRHRRDSLDAPSTRFHTQVFKTRRTTWKVWTSCARAPLMI